MVYALACVCGPENMFSRLCKGLGRNMSLGAKLKVEMGALICWSLYIKSWYDFTHYFGISRKVWLIFIYKDMGSHLYGIPVRKKTIYMSLYKILDNAEMIRVIWVLLDFFSSWMINEV